MSAGTVTSQHEAHRPLLLLGLGRDGRPGAGRHLRDHVDPRPGDVLALLLPHPLPVHLDCYRVQCKTRNLLTMLKEMAFCNLQNPKVEWLLRLP